MSSVVESYLRNCWKWASKNRELFIETELIVETIRAIAFCESCEKSYEATEHGKVCPYCGSMKNHLLEGDEFNIKEMNNALSKAEKDIVEAGRKANSK